MTLPYTFIDPDGDTLTVEQDGDSVLISITVEDDTCQVLVPPFQVREFAESLLAAVAQ